MTGNKAGPIIMKIIIAIVSVDFSCCRSIAQANLIKAGSVLKPAPFKSRGKNLAEGNRGPGLYWRKYGTCVMYHRPSCGPLHNSGHIAEILLLVQKPTCKVVNVFYNNI